MLENLKLSIDNKDFAGRVLMDLRHNKSAVISSKVAWLWIQETGFSFIMLLFVKLKTKNKDQCFQFLKGFNIRCASKIRPLLFNIYLSDLFFFLKYVGTCNFSHDTTTYISDGSLENVLKSLEKNSMLTISWFENNYIKLNTGKCHLVVSGYKLE